MDGQGHWRDNIVIERFWKTVKYEEISFKAYESISHAKKELVKFFDRYNTRRPHQGLNNRIPDDVYWATMPKMRNAV
jgi:transposase InsO family protein